MKSLKSFSFVKSNNSFFFIIQTMIRFNTFLALSIPMRFVTAASSLILPAGVLPSFSNRQLESDGGRRVIPFSEAQARLKLIGTEVEGIIVTDQKEARSTAADVSEGVLIMKGYVSGRETHKTDRGLVRRLHDHVPSYTVYGEFMAQKAEGEEMEIVVQPLIEISQGIEINIGARQDSQFGPAIIFGKGGKDSELYPEDKTIIVGMPDENGNLILTEDMIRERIQKTRTGKRLFGYRREHGNIEAVVALIQRLYALMLNNTEIEEVDLNPVFTKLFREGEAQEEIKILDVRMVQNDNPKPAPVFEAIDERVIEGLRAIEGFSRIAVIGATETPGIPREVTKRLIDLEKASKDIELVCVNPKRKEQGVKVFGKECCTIEEMEPVDIAVIVIDPRRVPDAYRELAEKEKAKAVVIISDGFGETGDEIGVRLQKELAALYEQYRLPILGPNCMGTREMFFFPEDRSKYPLGKSRAAIISQSGGIGARMVERFANLRLPLFCISIGNATFTDPAHVLEFMRRKAERGEISMLCTYIEDFSKGANIAHILGEIRKMIPVLVYYTGISDESSQKALTHTSSMVGDADLKRAMLEQAGVFPIHSLPGQSTMFETAAMLSTLPKPRSHKIQVISIGGAIEATTADSLKELGIEAAGVPIDIFGSANIAKLEEKLLESSLNSETGAIILHIYAQVPNLTSNPLLIAQAVRRTEKQLVMSVSMIPDLVQGSKERGIEIPQEILDAAGEREITFKSDDGKEYILALDGNGLALYVKRVPVIVVLEGDSPYSQKLEEALCSEGIYCVRNLDVHALKLWHEISFAPRYSNINFRMGR